MGTDRKTLLGLIILKYYKKAFNIFSRKAEVGLSIGPSELS